MPEAISAGLGHTLWPQAKALGRKPGKITENSLFCFMPWSTGGIQYQQKCFCGGFWYPVNFLFENQWVHRFPCPKNFTETESMAVMNLREAKPNEMVPGDATDLCLSSTNHRVLYPCQLSWGQIGKMAIWLTQKKCLKQFKLKKKKKTFHGKVQSAWKEQNPPSKLHTQCHCYLQE